MTSTISSKGQVTLPMRLRKQLGWKPGMKLEFEVADGFLMGRPAFDPSSMKSVLGCAAGYEVGRASREILAERRGYERSKL